MITVVAIAALAGIVMLVVECAAAGWLAARVLGERASLATSVAFGLVGAAAAHLVARHAGAAGVVGLGVRSFALTVLGALAAYVLAMVVRAR